MSKKRTVEDLTSELDKLALTEAEITDVFYDTTDALENATFIEDTEDGYLKPLNITKITALVLKINETIIKSNKIAKRANEIDRRLQKRT
mgnify:CR=1 FL=1